MHFDQIFKVSQIASWYLSGICFVNVEIAKWCVIILRSCFNAKSIRLLFDFKSVCFSVQRGINTLEFFNSQSIFLPRNETNEPQPSAHRQNVSNASFVGDVDGKTFEQIFKCRRRRDSKFPKEFAGTNIANRNSLPP